MIFFRTHGVRLNFQRGENKLALFGELKAYYSAPVDGLSGMTVNLKDVDQWMAKAQNALPKVQHVEEALRRCFSLLSGLSKDFEKVELSLGPVKVEYDGLRFCRTYGLWTWIRQDLTWVRTQVTLKTEAVLSKEFRSRLTRKKWSGSEVFAQALKAHRDDLQWVIVHRPDWKGAEKFQF